MNSSVQNKVLVVDDDPAMLRILTVHLGRSGYEVLTSNSGEQALKILEHDQPAYLITDLDMPEMNGLDLCRRVRQLELSHYVYIVFLSARAGDENLIAAMDAGADDFLNKPLRQHELQARLTAGARVLQLEARLSQLAEQDALSGLLLRRPFQGFLAKEWHRARRFRVPLSVVMLDIDHFKQVNDVHGHPAGDQAIRVVANLIQEHARGCDVVCRYGGEEFCVLLPETNEAMAMAWAEELRTNIAAASIQFGETDLSVTASAGVAEMLTDLESWEQLLALADQCLLAAKRAGRNCVVSDRTLSEGNVGVGRLFSDAISYGFLAREAMIPLVHCVRPDWPLARGAAYLLRYRVSSAPVTDDDGNLLGILSDKDVLGAAHRSELTRQCVSDMMCRNLITYDETDPLAQVLGFLSRASLRSVVILSAGKPTGLVTRGSLIRWFLSIASRQDAFDSSVAVDPADDSVEWDTTVERLADLLVGEANRLHHSIVAGQGDQDLAPIVAGRSRIQWLVDELLAGSAGDRQTTLGLPF